MVFLDSFIIHIILLFYVSGICIILGNVGDFCQLKKIFLRNYLVFKNNHMLEFKDELKAFHIQFFFKLFYYKG